MVFDSPYEEPVIGTVWMHRAAGQFRGIGHQLRNGRIENFMRRNVSAPFAQTGTGDVRQGAL